MSDDQDSYDPVCLHKDDGAYETRVGYCCPICGMIRHRHSRLVLVSVKTIGGITILTDVAVPVAVDQADQNNTESRGKQYPV